MEPVPASYRLQREPQRHHWLCALAPDHCHVTSARQGSVGKVRPGRLASEGLLGHNARMGKPKRSATGRTADGSSDRRWVVLSPDGRWATLGRSRDPSEEDIARAAAALPCGGWLAVMSGSPYAAGVPTFLEVRRLGDPVRGFGEAVVDALAAVAAERARAVG